MDKAIRKARRSLGYTQQQLADMIGVNREVISHIESGRRKYHDVIRLAAMELGIYLEYLHTVDRGNGAVAITKKDIIEGLKSKRKALGLKRVHVSQVSGVATGTIGKYESGRIGQLDNLIAIMDTLGLKLVVVDNCKKGDL